MAIFRITTEEDGDRSHTYWVDESNASTLIDYLRDDPLVVTWDVETMEQTDEGFVPA